MILARPLTSTALLMLVACGGGESPPPPNTPAHAVAGPVVATSPSAAPSTVPPLAVEPETPAAVFARVEPDLVACYEQGRKAVPKMLSGRATISVAVSGEGRSTCVVVGDDTGLTQAVEDCMSDRLSRETFTATGAPWTTELSVVVRDGKLASSAGASAGPTLATLETHGLPDSAHDVVLSLVPRFRTCTADTGAGEQSLQIVHVGARVAKDGRVACALASAPMPVPPKLRTCMVDVLASAAFPPPTGPFGLVMVPVKVHGRK